MNEVKILEQRVQRQEQKVQQQKSLIDNFSGRVIFNKEVQFNGNVYDANGGVVTEINNI